MNFDVRNLKFVGRKVVGTVLHDEFNVHEHYRRVS